MPDLTQHKNNIVLSDYNYERDIENRTLMAEFSLFDVDVLREILDGSLRTTIKHLLKYLDTTEKKLLPTLEKLRKAKLIQIQGDQITVDKEMRKYYESQIDKFDDDFEPNMEFLQGLLSKVPIHALPNWYSIPLMTNNIFGSIVESYLLTPKIYEDYLAHIKFPKPAMKGIMKDLFASPELKISGKKIMEKYHLSRQEFEEHMLFLEFSFVCCLGYNQVEGMWEEVVVPFHEWKCYLNSLDQLAPKPIKNVNAIVPVHQQEFGFLRDMSHLLEVIIDSGIKLTKGTLSPEKISKLFPDLPKEMERSAYFAQLLDTLKVMELARIKGSEIIPEEKAEQWLDKSLENQAHLLSRYYVSELSNTIRDFREVKNSLKRVSKSGWIFVDDFLASVNGAIGNATPVSLQNKGKTWRYTQPTYTPKEQDYIVSILYEVLFETGAIELGFYQKKPCFIITPFGQHVL